MACEPAPVLSYLCLFTLTHAHADTPRLPCTQMAQMGRGGARKVGGCVRSCGEAAEQGLLALTASTACRPFPFRTSPSQSGGTQNVMNATICILALLSDVGTAASHAMQRYA